MMGYKEINGTYYNKRTYIFGSISHGTMRDVDLLDSFSNALEYLAKKNNEVDYLTICVDARRYRDFLIEYEDMLWKDHHKKIRESIFETVSYIINEDLIGALNEFAPPYFYFGSHPGDGSDYGFWLSEDAIDGSFDGLKVSDLSEVPKDYAGEILLVNDHGNTSLYYKYRTSQKLHEIWSIV
jgi:hypothetical protein